MHPDSSSVTLQALNLKRRFGDRIAVNRVSIELYRGEVLGLLVTNGAGKSTTLRMLTGNLALSAGINPLKKHIRA